MSGFSSPVGRRAMGGQSAGEGLDAAQAAGLAGAEATALGGGVYGNEPDVGGDDGRLHGGGEMQVAAPAAPHDFGQAGLVDR
jgi:hypothetical protein